MYKPKFYDRQSMRLKDYDYSSRGHYFITMLTRKRAPIFGMIKEGQMELSIIGFIVYEEWLKSSNIRENIDLDEFIIMPDHFHAIVKINCKMSDQLPGSFESPSKNLGSLVRGFKSAVTQRVKVYATSSFPANTFKDESVRKLDLGESLWHRNYHDRIIRDARELSNTRKYIRENPLKWRE